MQHVNSDSADEQSVSAYHAQTIYVTYFHEIFKTSILQKELRQRSLAFAGRDLFKLSRTFAASAS